MNTWRHLIFVLGDQLDENLSAFIDFDSSQDCVFMAEVREESTRGAQGKKYYALVCGRT